MTSLQTEISKIFSVGDSVLINGNGNNPRVITKILHNKLQIDGQEWVRALDATPVYGDTPAKKQRRNKPRLSSAEYVNILRAMGYTFTMSELDNRVYVNGSPIDDMLAAQIRAEMRDGGHVCVRVIEDVYAAEALQNSFHPVKVYLESLKWDGDEHIAKLSQYFDDKDNIFFPFFRRWMIGAVAKVYEAAQNPMLVLDGIQDAGKSFFVRWLASPIPEMHVEGPIRPDNKDDLINLISRWIWEVAELGSTTRRSDREALKHFLTTERVTVRVPYGHYNMTKPALASFIGTVNNEGGGILDDPTGNRRFVIIDLKKINWEYAKMDAGQLWAEAYAAYKTGEDWRLQNEERQLSREINERYRVQDPLEDLITQMYEIDETRFDWIMPTNNILDALHIAGWRLHSPRSEAMALASTLKTMPVIKPDNKITDPNTGQQVRGYIGMRRRNQPTYNNQPTAI